MQIHAPVTCFDLCMEEPVSACHGRSQVVYYTRRSHDKESANEDALAVIPVNDNLLVLAVADGLGGLPAGEAASRLVIDFLVEALTGINGDDISHREIILDCIDRANRAILELRNNAATTLVVAEIQDRTLRTYHVGDSMLMLMGNRGKMKYSAIPHSPTGYALISGMIDESEAMLDKERHFISNYVGSQDMRVEVGPTLQLAPRDTLLLASDGVSDNLFDHEIIDIVRRGKLQDAGIGLAAECRKYMTRFSPDRTCHPDDLTFILYRMKGGKC